MGPWSVTGGSERQFFRVGESGYSASGRGKHHYPHFGWELKQLASFRHQPAEWTVYHASDAADSARLIGLNVSNMTEHLDPELVRLAQTPIWVISKYQESVGFAVFLPDRQYRGVMGWLERIAGGAPMTYQFNFGFSGLTPQLVQDHTELVSCDEWLKGRPYVGHGDDFSFIVNSKETLS